MNRQAKTRILPFGDSRGVGCQVGILIAPADILCVCRRRKQKHAGEKNAQEAIYKGS